MRLKIVVPDLHYMFAATICVLKTRSRFRTSAFIIDVGMTSKFGSQPLIDDE
jgi:hypothetical protein